MALRARVARRYSILINVLIGVIIFVNALVNGAANFDLTFLTGKIPADWMKVLAVLKGCAIITAPIAAAGLVIAYSIKSA